VLGGTALGLCILLSAVTFPVADRCAHGWATGAAAVTMRSDCTRWFFPWAARLALLSATHPVVAPSVQDNDAQVAALHSLDQMVRATPPPLSRSRSSSNNSS
jgi:hypothetical protein